MYKVSLVAVQRCLSCSDGLNWRWDLGTILLWNKQMRNHTVIVQHVLT